MPGGRPGDGHPVFVNNVPGGLKFLRPILLSFRKETEQLVLDVSNYHEHEIRELVPFTFIVCEKTITVTYHVIPSMRDGKELRILTQNILREQHGLHNFLKNWPIPKSVKLDNNTCLICLQRPETYRSYKSFHFKPVMFEFIKKYGFCVMHKKIGGMSFIWKAAEKGELKRSGGTLKDIRHNWQKMFQQATGVCFWEPDPVNRGNSNNGPAAMRFFNNPSLASKILKIPGETIAIIGVLIDMINSTKFQDPNVFLALSMTAHHLLVRDIGPDIILSGSIHSLMCHGDMYIRYAQDILGIPLGFLTENAIEMGNKQNKQFKRLFSRKNSIVNETEDIFQRRLLVTDPILCIDEEQRQTVRRGKIRRKK